MWDLAIPTNLPSMKTCAVVDGDNRTFACNDPVNHSVAARVITNASAWIVVGGEIADRN